MKFRTKALGLALLCALSQNAFSEQLDVWIRASNDSKVIYQKLADQFQKETGISIKYFNAVTDFDQRLARAATGNALPDVVFNDAIIVGQMVQLGIVDEIKPSELKGGGDIYDAAWKSAQQPDGKYYGVPTSAHTYALFIRQDWLNKLNLKAPGNWDELKKVAQAFTHDDPDGNGKNDTYGFTMPLATTRGYASSFSSSYLWQAGANYLVATQPGKFKAALDSKEMVTAMEFMRGMVCEGWRSRARSTTPPPMPTPPSVPGKPVCTPPARTILRCLIKIRVKRPTPWCRHRQALAARSPWRKGPPRS